METQHFSIRVNAPAHVVWQTMFDDSTYRQWTSVFDPNSYFEGDWLSGSEIRFLATGDDGRMSGMYGVITENRPYEYVLIEYQGQIVNDVDDTTSREARQLIGAREAYSFSEADGTTTVTVDVDTADTYAELFGELWPKGLAKLKELAEATAQGR
jgi:hypothetical protein